MDIRASTDQATGRTGVWIEKQTVGERLAYRTGVPGDSPLLFISMDRDAWVQLIYSLGDVLNLDMAAAPPRLSERLTVVQGHLDETDETWSQGTLLTADPDHMAKALSLLTDTIALQARSLDIIEADNNDLRARLDQATASHPFAGWTRADVQAAAVASRIWEAEHRGEPDPHVGD